MSRFRILLTSLVVLAVATGLVACGGSSSSNVDPKQVLDKTFNNQQTIKSADLNASLGVKSSGSNGGDFTFSLSGPFESQGKSQLPKLDWEVKAEGSGGGQNINFTGGLINTGSDAFVSYNGTDYKVDSSTYQSLQSLVQNAANQNQSQQNSAAQLKKFGISEDLLTNLNSDGTTDVGGTNTNHISGELDINKAVDAISNVVNSGQLSQIPGASVPSGAQLQQLKTAIKSATFDVYSGTDDNLLRKFDANLSIEVPGQGSADITLSVELDGVNQSQTIQAPSNSKPLSALLSQFGISPSSLSALGALSGGTSGLGSLGAATGGSTGSTGSTGSSGSSGSSGGSGGSSATQAQAYLNCISGASTAAAIQRCQALAP